MSEPFLYITKSQYDEILEGLNIDITEDGGFNAKKSKSLLERAVGDLESDLVERFVVPLRGLKGVYATAPQYSRQKILNAISSKVRQLIGLDEQKNITIDSTERFIDLKKADYNGHMKDLLNHKRTFQFKLQSFAADGAVEPVQTIGVARANNKRESFIDDSEEFIL